MPGAGSRASQGGLGRRRDPRRRSLRLRSPRPLGHPLPAGGPKSAPRRRAGRTRRSPAALGSDRGVGEHPHRIGLARHRARRAWPFSTPSSRAAALLFPEIGVAIVRRALLRSRYLAILVAIVSQRKVETRLVMLFWHLADRFGHMRDGWVDVPGAADPQPARGDGGCEAAVGDDGARGPGRTRGAAAHTAWLALAGAGA